jgi:sortase A
MVAVFVAATLDGSLVSRAEVRQFRAAQALRTFRGPSWNIGKLPVDFTLWSRQRVTYYQQALMNHVDTPLAVLRISKVALEAPVLEGTDDFILNRGLGHISGTALPGQEGNVGIAGHRDSFFRVLKDIAVGDKIELEANIGTHEYTVTQILVVEPSDVAVLQPRAIPALTLVTCYPFYFVGSAPKRYIVQASIDSAASSTEKNSKSMQEISQ